MGKNYNFSKKVNEDKLFFSLADYRNNYFINNNPEKIIEFYNSFTDKSQLLEWMKNRPKGNSVIREIQGDKDIIVVIPTMDADGKLAQACKENIFKGLHIIFIESGYNNFYFNGAHNVNLGFKKALEYNPKWIIFSGDDMYKVDDVNKLMSELKTVNNEDKDIVFTKPSLYHSSPERIGKRNLFFILYYLSTNKNKQRDLLKLYNKYKIKYFPSPTTGKYSLLFKKGYTYLEIQDFAIYSSNFVAAKKGAVYDETFVNAAEDTDLSLMFSLNRQKLAVVDYKIEDMIGRSLGTGIQRDIRSIAGLMYLNTKWENTLEQII